MKSKNIEQTFTLFFFRFLLMIFLNISLKIGLLRSETIHSTPSNPNFFATLNSFCQLAIGKY